MLNELERLHAACFPNKPWSANDFADLKKSGCDIMASQNGFAVWRVVADESEIIENDAKQRGAQKIFLEVAENNHPARAMYERNGFVQIGVRPKYYDGIDAILMEKKL